ncbi:electron transfer flavoprotein subunit beta [Arthrobacter sp. MYb23]|uniref:electron transfer flavoprotein subunit beta/FixA family protein n=1 Tax=unclassified Arthrobacter TaxID=235627 RepID=UPI000CFCB516|nr:MULTISPECIES: electron transfer flavoprotein subunit beta/FixA family protein [unclassified Arthrobacter]PRB41091.1 electron transfer flavoprotein subunit beta [Arthrobacter sp. MYb51]PRB94761.1 electron transfer flavoprotein subunit beta [Arthrobacter sp. MYb23]
MKIIVLVKQVPDTEEERRLDPVTGLLDRGANECVADEINERALEVALRHRDANKGTEVVALTVGPASATAVLRKALSMGADSAVHVVDDLLEGADIAATARVLAAAVQQAGFDLVVTGNESTDGRGGVVPAMVAEHLGLPLLSSLNTMEITPERVAGEATVEAGNLTVSALLPAIVSVTERSAEARFPNFKGILTAKRKPLATLSLEDLGVIPHGGGANSTVLTVSERPARTAGKKIVDDGTAAKDLADFLVASRLI